MITARTSTPCGRTERGLEFERVEPKFIVDVNAGKLAKWLRMMGYDALLFDELDDGRMVKTALAEGRTIITKDSEFIKRRAVVTGRVKAVLVAGDDPEKQMQTVIGKLKLARDFKPFSRCLECNAELQSRHQSQVKDSVPPRVFERHGEYMECPVCRRIYWRGTHWESMDRKLQEFNSGGPGRSEGETP